MGCRSENGLPQFSISWIRDQLRARFLALKDTSNSLLYPSLCSFDSFCSQVQSIAQLEHFPGWISCLIPQNLWPLYRSKRYSCIHPSKVVLATSTSQWHSMADSSHYNMSEGLLRLWNCSKRKSAGLLWKGQLRKDLGYQWLKFLALSSTYWGDRPKRIHRSIFKELLWNLSVLGPWEQVLCSFSPLVTQKSFTRTEKQSNLIVLDSYLCTKSTLWCEWYSLW